MKIFAFVLSFLALASWAVALKNPNICGDVAFAGTNNDPHCGQSIDAYTYVVDSNECVSFVHHCGSSNNVFYSRETCESTCKE